MKLSGPEIGIAVILLVCALSLLCIGVAVACELISAWREARRQDKLRGKR